MIITKTLTALVSDSGSNYPYNYAWSSTCNNNITYGTPTGVVTANGNIVTTISYDSTVCLECIFSLNFNNTSCSKVEDDKFTNYLTCGTVYFYPSANSSIASIVETSFSCHPANGVACTTQVLFGTYHITVSNVTCNTAGQTSTVTCNGVTQSGPNTNFLVTTDYNNPNIVVYINCA